MAPKLVLTPRNSQPLTPRSAAAETAAAALVVEGFNPSIGTSSGVEYPAGAPGDFRRRRLSVTAKAVEGGSEANAEQFRRRRLSVVQRTIMGPAAAAPSASPASSSPRGSGGGLTGMFRRRRNSASASAPSDSSAAPSTSAPSGGVFSGLFRRRKLSVVGQTIEDGAAAAQLLDNAKFL